jgi:N-methylhydantoinase B/oxoprolinase/acetone carboxylase alpha subunit
MVMHNRDGHLTVVDQNRIARDSQTTKIITKTAEKDYKIVFDCNDFTLRVGIKRLLMQSVD